MDEENEIFSPLPAVAVRDYYVLEPGVGGNFFCMGHLSVQPMFCFGLQRTLNGVQQHLESIFIPWLSLKPTIFHLK